MPAPTPRPNPSEVALRQGLTASRALQGLLADARARFDCLRSVDVPDDAATFKRRFASVLIDFETARLGSADRLAIAEHITDAARALLTFRGPDGEEVALSEWLARPTEPLARETVQGTRALRFAPTVPFDGQQWERDGIEALIDDLAGRSLMSAPAATRLRAFAQAAIADGLDLTGERFVLFGAGAELAPTPMLLEAGADVLWLDVRPPPEHLRDPELFAGRLTWCPDGVDLLASPAEALATVRAWLEEGPAHLGLFAYAGGSVREWRLEGAMNAIVDALPEGGVRSVGLYVSPTSPNPVASGDVASAEEKLRRSRWWQRALSGSGVLRRAPLADAPLVSRTILPTQGASYQAAQYIEKILAAEVLAARRPGLRVSANVAGITRTGSLKKALFEAGFIGAWEFGVAIFEPAATRTLSGLLLLADILQNGADGLDGELRQIHSGTFSMPWELERAIATSACIGLAKRPSLLPRVVRGS